MAGGNNTRGGNAAYIGHKAADIGHHRNVLADSGLLRREPDVFRSGRSAYRIAEPHVAFYQVGSGVVADPSRRSQIEVDVVLLAPAVPGEARRVLSLGEAKWGEVMGTRHVERLRRARDLLAGRGYDTRDTFLACYSGAGFEPGMGGDVLAVGLDRICTEPE